MSNIAKKHLFTISKVIYSLSCLLLFIPGVSASQKQDRPNNGNAFRSCGERAPMFKDDFRKLVADKRITFDKAETAFEAMVDLSLELAPNSKELNPKGSRSVYSPNIKDTVVPDGLISFFLEERGSEKLLGEWQDSTIFEVKTTASKPIGLADSDYQVAKYLDYLSNASPASSSPGTGDYNPIPNLVFVTLADTEIASGITERASNPREATIYNSNGRRRRVAVWQQFVCKPTEIEKLFGAALIVGDAILLNREVRELDGFRDQELYIKPGKLVGVPQVFVVKSNKETIDFTTLLQDPREDLAGGIVSPPPDSPPPPPPPDDPTPPPPPPPPPSEQCTSISSMQFHDLCFSADHTELYARMEPNTTYTAMYYNCYPYAVTAVSDSTGLAVFDFINPVRGGISDCGPVSVNMNIYSGNDIIGTPILSVYTNSIPTASW